MKKILEKTALYTIRKSRGLSQREIAEALGTIPTQISKLENGERKLSPEWLERLSAVLGCSKAELLGEEPALTEKEQAFLEMFRNLSEREQNSIMAAFNVLAQPKQPIKTGNDK